MHEFWQLGQSNFRTDDEKKIWKLNHLIQKQLLIETLTDEILTVALREIQLETQNESDKYSTSGSFGLSDMRFNEINSLLGNRFIFYDIDRSKAGNFRGNIVWLLN